MQAALRHHLDQVTEAELVAQIPAHAQNDDLTVKMPPCKQILDAPQLAHCRPSVSSKDQLYPTACLYLHQSPSVNVGAGPDDVSFADFNGDGIEDIVVTNYTSGTINLVMGTSGWTYTVLGPFSVGTGPYSAAVGDINLDGTPDLVVSNCFSNNTGVLFDGTQIATSYSNL
jgi:hypothetical protein